MEAWTHNIKHANLTPISAEMLCNIPAIARVSNDSVKYRKGPKEQQTMPKLTILVHQLILNTC